MPLLKIAIVFIAGILSIHLCGIEHEAFLTLAVLISMLYSSVIFCKFFPNHFNLNFLLTTLVFFLGALCFCSNKPSLETNYYDHNDSVCLLGEIKSISNTNKFWKTTIRVNYGIDSAFTISPSSGLIQIYLAKDNRHSPKLGQLLLFPSQYHSIPENENPLTFDYKRYLKFQKIDFQSFVSSDNWHVFENASPGFYKYSIYKLKERFEKILDHHFQDPENNAIMKAISLGIKDDIPEKLKRAFQNTGAIHVLAISGLHVGILTGIFIYLLRLNFCRRGGMRLVIATSALIFIWAFVILTGCTPSVVRSAFMFSLLLISMLLNKTVNAYNIIGAAALIMLLFDPYVLFQVSFQFSFLALLSIIYFYPVIKSLLPYQYFPKLLVYFLDIVLVSLAAQILIAPLSIYYFNQISLMSSISSLVAIPAIGFLLYDLILLLLLDYHLPEVSNYLSICGSFVLGFMKRFIFMLNDLAYCKVSDIYYPIYLVILQYVLIVQLMYAINKRKIFVYLFLFSFIIYKVINMSNKQYQYSDSSMTVYQCDKGLLFDIFCGETCITFADDKIPDRDIVFNAHKHRLYKNITNKIEINKNDVKEKVIKYCVANQSVTMVIGLELNEPIYSDHLFLIDHAKIDSTAFSNSHVSKLYIDPKLVNQKLLTNDRCDVIGYGTKKISIQ